MPSVARPTGRADDSKRESENGNDDQLKLGKDDILVAATPNSQEPEQSSDPLQDQLAPCSPVASSQSQSQSQGNPAWLAHPVATQHQSDPPAEAPVEEQVEAQGSLAFGAPEFDHAMYAGGSSDTQPPTPAEEPESESVQRESQTQLQIPLAAHQVSRPPVITSPPPTKRQSKPPSPPPAKKQRKPTPSPAPEPETIDSSTTDSFASRRGAPKESAEALALRLQRERQAELGRISVVGLENIAEERGQADPARNRNHLGDSSHSSSEQNATNSIERTAPPNNKEPQKEPGDVRVSGDDDESVMHRSRSFEETQQPLGARQGLSEHRKLSPQNDQVSTLLDSSARQESNSLQFQNAQPSPINPSASSPAADRSIIPDSEANMHSEGLSDHLPTSPPSLEPTQPDGELPQPAMPVVEPTLVARSVSLATEVSSGTSGKRFTIPPKRALVRRPPPLPEAESVAWMSTRLPGTTPLTAELNLEVIPGSAESPDQAATKSDKQTSPLKETAANRRTDSPMSLSPTPAAPQVEGSPAPSAIGASLDKKRSIELPSPARPAPHTFNKRSRASSSRQNYNEDSTDDEERDRESSATPIDVTDDSYRPTPPQRSQASSKLTRKTSKSSKRTSKASTPASVVPATPETNTLPTTKQHRVLGLWSKNSQWYPATIIGIDKAAKNFNLRFDDGSQLNPAKIDEIRCLRICPGDLIVWDKRKPVSAFVRNEWTGYTTTKSSPGPRVFANTPAANDLGEIPLSKCSILPPRGISSVNALADRRLPPALLTIAPANPPPIVSPARSRLNSTRPTPSLASPIKRGSTNTTTYPSIFAGVAFFLTFKSADDNHIHKVRDIVEQAGGTVLPEFHDLFPVPQSFDRGRECIKVAASTSFRTAFCLVDEPSTKPKFLCALAIGMPCLSWRYVQDACMIKSRLDWRPYLVSAGYSTRLSSWTSQVVNCQWADGYCLSELLENDTVRRPLWGKRVACCLSSKDKIHIPLFPFLLCALGASSVVVANSIAELSDEANISVLIVKDDKAKISVKDFKGTVGTVEWVKQTLITGGWQGI